MNAGTATSAGTIESGQVHLRLDRTIYQGLHEDYDLTNYSASPIELDLEIRIEGDYADLFDVKEGRLLRRGSLESAWDAGERTLTTHYRNLDFERGLRIDVRRQSSEPRFANGLLSFRIQLGPKEGWHTCLLWSPLGVDEQAQGPTDVCHALLTGHADLAERRGEWRRRATRIRTSDPAVDAVLARAIDDLGALRMQRHDQVAAAGVVEDVHVMVPSAGIPWFVSLFGRDALVVSLQTLPLTPGLAIGSLEALATLQGDGYDDRHDRQPARSNTSSVTASSPTLVSSRRPPTSEPTTRRRSTSGRRPRRGAGLRTVRCSNDCGGTSNARSSGSTATGTWTETDCRSTKRGPRTGGTTTRAGRTPAWRSSGR